MTNLISWNVNGIRSCIDKGFYDTLSDLNPDIICLQETKIQAGQLELELPDYKQFFFYAKKPGYSGTAILSKVEPIRIMYGLGVEEFDAEARCIAAEYEHFFVVCIYAPNSQYELRRLDYRLRFEEKLLNQILQFEKIKPVIYCGDLNVAHTELDLKHPESNRFSAGFSDEERDAFSYALEHGYVDTFRHIYKSTYGAYSFYSYRVRAMHSDSGWRLDYFVASKKLIPYLMSAGIYKDVTGSDHVPVSLTLGL